jgi:YD repeat-containing protein
LPESLVLAYDSQSSATQKFRLNVDRAATVDESGSVTVDDRALRPLTFTGGPSSFVAPPGVHASLTSTSDGGYDLAFYDDPDTVDHFAKSGSDVLFTARKNVYGASLSVSRDANGRVSTITPAARPAVSVTYDDSGNLQSISLPIGAATFTFDGGQLVGYASPNQKGQYSFDYQASGDTSLISAVTWPGGGNASLALNDDGTVSSITYVDSSVAVSYVSATEVDLLDGYGNTSVLGYQSGLLTSLADPDGTETYAWTDGRDMTTRVDKGGRTTSRTVDEHGHVLSSTDVLGNTTTWTWSGDRPASRAKDGIKTSYERDTYGRTLTEKITAGTETRTKTYTWTSQGLVESMTELGVTAKYTWTGTDQLLSVQKNGTTIVSYDYDDLGRTASIATAAGKTTYTYATTSDLYPNTATLPSGVVSTFDNSGSTPAATVTVQAPGASQSVSASTQFDDSGRPVGYSINNNPVASVAYSQQATPSSDGGN